MLLRNLAPHFLSDVIPRSLGPWADGESLVAFPWAFFLLAPESASEERVNACPGRSVRAGGSLVPGSVLFGG